MDIELTPGTELVANDRFVEVDGLESPSTVRVRDVVTKQFAVLPIAQLRPRAPDRRCSNPLELKAGGGNTDYNREHTWPSSYGFPNDNASNYPYTDRPSNSGRAGPECLGRPATPAEWRVEGSRQ